MPSVQHNVHFPIMHYPKLEENLQESVVKEEEEGMFLTAAESQRLYLGMKVCAETQITNKKLKEEIEKLKMNANKMPPSEIMLGKLNTFYEKNPKKIISLLTISAVLFFPVILIIMISWLIVAVYQNIFKKHK